MVDVLNANDLKSATRNLTFPFEVIVRCKDHAHHITVESNLRMVPGKRLVALARLNDQPVVVKLFFGGAAQDQLDREIAGNAGFKRAKVDSPEIVFQGRLDPNGYCIAFEWLEGSETLANQLKACDDIQKERDILRIIVGAVATMHNSGIVQHDIHPSNFLVQNDTLKVIDGGDVSVEKIGSEVPKHVAMDNLALLFGQLIPHYDQHIPSLLQVYTDLREWLPNEIRLADLLDRVQRWRQGRLKKVMKKVQRNSTDFAVYEDDFSKGMFKRQFDSESLRMLLGNPEYVMKDSYVIKNGNTATVAIAELDGIPIVIKRYNIRTTTQQVRWSVQKSRACRSWEGGLLLNFWGLHSPNPIAYIDQWKGMLRGNSYYIAEHIEGPSAYDLFAEQSSYRHYDNNLVNAFVSLFEHLAMAQVSHGDCKATNFLVKDNEPWVLDLDSLTYHKSARIHRAAFAKDVNRFLRNWEAFPGLHAIFKGQLERFIH